VWGVRKFKGLFSLSSIRMKLILIFSLLFIISFTAIIVITGWQTREKTEESVISQTDGMVAELNNSVQLFLGQYEKSVQQFTISNSLKEYARVQMEKEERKVAGTDLYASVQADFDNYLSLYEEASSIYLASPNKKLKIVPSADLPSDFDPTSRDWYKEAKEAKSELVWSDPYIDEATDEYIITASQAVVANSKVVGVIGVDINLSRLTDSIAKMDIGYEGYPFMMATDGTAIVHPSERGDNLSKYDFIKKILDSDQKSGTVNYSLDGEDKLMIYHTVPKTNWVIGASYTEKNLLKTSKEIENILFLTAVITLIIMLVIVISVSNAMTKPLKKLQQTVTNVAAGDLIIQSDVKSKDEIGRLASDFNEMIGNMRNTLRVVQDSVVNVRGAAEGLSAVSEETNASSEEMATAVTEIANGASQSASDAEEANNKFSLLGERINEVYEKAKGMSEMAGKADDMNHSGIQQMDKLQESYQSSRQFISSMEKVILNLEDNVRTIEKVMGTITDISSQTNLLALNASIEAARAGEHGKGFAVVADEVRKLAEQSVHATEEVRQTILDIQMSSEKAVEEMFKTKETVDDQYHVVQQTNQIFENTASLMKEMQAEITSVYNEVEKINADKDEVVNVIHMMSATSEQTAASCQQVSASTDEQLRAIQSVTDSAEKLTQLSYELQESIERFKI
jgi:methyl-accepting chemotaxis protein